MTPLGRTTTATILIIEPHAAVLKAVALLLEHSEFEVLTAGSAQDGMLVDVGFPRPIHLLLSSINLPGTTGPELAKAMKVRRPDMRVMFMSSYPDGALLVLNYGWQFITKQFISVALVAKVKDTLSSMTPEQEMDGFDTRKKPLRSSAGKPF